MGTTSKLLRHDQLCELMDHMSRGDSSALFQFVEDFRPELTATVRSVLGAIGRRDAGRSGPDLDFLVLTAGLVVYDRASRWNRDGAVPWLWAIRAIQSDIVSWLGHPRVEFVNEHHMPIPAPTSSTGDVSYLHLADRCDEVAGWIEATYRVASERNASVHLEYQTQKSLGDPSPAHTVGEQFELKPANVRQIDRRVRQQLAQSAEAGENRVLAWIQA